MTKQMTMDQLLDSAESVGELVHTYTNRVQEFQLRSPMTTRGRTIEGVVVKQLLEPEDDRSRSLFCAEITYHRHLARRLCPQSYFRIPLLLGLDLEKGILIMERAPGLSMLETFTDDAAVLRGIFPIATFMRVLNETKRQRTTGVLLSETSHYQDLLRRLERDTERIGDAEKLQVVTKRAQDYAGTEVGPYIYFTHGDQSISNFYESPSHLYCIDFNASTPAPLAREAAAFISNAHFTLATSGYRDPFIKRAIALFLEAYQVGMSKQEKRRFEELLPFYLIEQESKKTREIGVDGVTYNLEQVYSVPIRG